MREILINFKCRSCCCGCTRLMTQLADSIDTNQLRIHRQNFQFHCDFWHRLDFNRKAHKIWVARKRPSAWKLRKSLLLFLEKIVCARQRHTNKEGLMRGRFEEGKAKITIDWGWRVVELVGVVQNDLLKSRKYSKVRILILKDVHALKVLKLGYYFS